MFYTDILTREKIRAGKFIIDKLLEEGWEIHGAAWLLHGYIPEPDEWYPGYESEKTWTLHFYMQGGTPETENWAYGRIFDLRKAYVEELYDDALLDDYFEISVSPPDARQMKRLLELPPPEHPLGERRYYGHSSSIRDCFVYNLGETPATKAERKDARPA